MFVASSGLYSFNTPHVCRPYISILFYSECQLNCGPKRDSNHWSLWDFCVDNRRSNNPSHQSWCFPNSFTRSIFETVIWNTILLDTKRAIWLVDIQIQDLDLSAIQMVTLFECTVFGSPLYSSVWSVTAQLAASEILIPTKVKLIAFPKQTNIYLPTYCQDLSLLKGIQNLANSKNTALYHF